MFLACKLISIQFKNDDDEATRFESDYMKGKRARIKKRERERESARERWLEGRSENNREYTTQLERKREEKKSTSSSSYSLFK